MNGERPPFLNQERSMKHSFEKLPQDMFPRQSCRIPKVILA